MTLFFVGATALLPHGRGDLCAWLRSVHGRVFAGEQVHGPEGPESEREFEHDPTPQAGQKRLRTRMLDLA